MTREEALKVIEILDVWVGYVPEYFQEKHNFEGDKKRIMRMAGVSCDGCKHKPKRGYPNPAICGECSLGYGDEYEEL